VTYRLLYQPSAAEELDQAIKWSFEHYPNTAGIWCGELLSAIEALRHDPERHPLARENDFFTVTIRQLVHGSGKSVYRILYTVEDDTVRILHIRFPGQPLLD
jgi:hypothetical protein